MKNYYCLIFDGGQIGRCKSDANDNNSVEPLNEVYSVLICIVDHLNDK